MSFLSNLEPSLDETPFIAIGLPIQRLIGQCVVRAPDGAWRRKRTPPVTPQPLSQIRKFARPKRKGPGMTAEPFAIPSTTTVIFEKDELAGLRIRPRLQPIEVDAAPQSSEEDIRSPTAIALMLTFPIPELTCIQVAPLFVITLTHENQCAGDVLRDKNEGLNQT